MKRWNLAGPCLAALLLFQAAGAALAQAPVNPQLQEQLRLQEEIYRSRGEKVPEGYVINRSLLAYSFTLPDDFSYSLTGLGPNDRWLDIGAGEGQAVLDYFTDRFDLIGRRVRGTGASRGKAKAIAMSIEDRRTPEWQQVSGKLAPGQVGYVYGKRLREYTAEELGRFQLITDVIGGFSYSNDLTLYMEKTLAMLETNGNFFTLLQDVHSEEGTNPPHYAGAPYLTEIQDADGSKLKVCNWLKRITCVRVTCELRTRWRPNIEVYHVRKVCDEVVVPPLALVHFEAGTPPERRYQVKTIAGPAAAKPAAPSK
jgi:hypothetical protein